MNPLPSWAKIRDQVRLFRSELVRLLNLDGKAISDRTFYALVVISAMYAASLLFFARIGFFIFPQHKMGFAILPYVIFMFAFFALLFVDHRLNLVKWLAALPPHRRFVAIFGIALVLRFVLLLDAGAASSDLLSYVDRSHALLDGALPYRDKEMHKPPCYAYLLYLIGKAFGPGVLQFRAFFSFVDSVVAACVYRLLRCKAGKEISAAGAFLYAICPLPIVIAGLGGHYDPLVSLFVILAVIDFFSGRYYRSALLLGLGFAFKLYPFVLLPWLAWVAGERIARGRRGGERIARGRRAGERIARGRRAGERIARERRAGGGIAGERMAGKEEKPDHSSLSNTLHVWKGRMVYCLLFFLPAGASALPLYLTDPATISTYISYQTGKWVSKANKSFSFAIIEFTGHETFIGVWITKWVFLVFALMLGFMFLHWLRSRQDKNELERMLLLWYRVVVVLYILYLGSQIVASISFYNTARGAALVVVMVGATIGYFSILYFGLRKVRRFVFPERMAAVREEEMYLLCVFSMMLLLFGSPDYPPWYIIWMIPFMLGIRTRAMRNTLFFLSFWNFPVKGIPLLP